MRFFLVTLFLLLSHQVFAASVCVDFFPRTLSSGSFSVPLRGNAPKAVPGNRINEANQARWVEAHRAMGPAYHVLAQLLSSHMRLLSQRGLERNLKVSIDEFFRRIPANFEYVILITDPNLRDTQYWLANLVKDLYPDRPPTEAVVLDTKEDFLLYNEQHPNRALLIVDDASYSGWSITDGLPWSDPFDVFHLPIFVALAGVTAEGFNHLSSRILNTNILAAEQFRSVSYLIQNYISDPQVQTYLARALVNQYGETALDTSVVGFAHNIPGFASILGVSGDDDYNSAGSIPDLVTDIPASLENINGRGETVLDGAVMGPNNQLLGWIPFVEEVAPPYQRLFQ